MKMIFVNIFSWTYSKESYRYMDVEFNVHGEKFYACSSILIKDLNIFAKILSDQWFESTFLYQRNYQHK